jgi:hypothetical protein
MSIQLNPDVEIVFRDAGWEPGAGGRQRAGRRLSLAGFLSRIRKLLRIPPKPQPSLAIPEFASEYVNEFGGLKILNSRSIGVNLSQTSIEFDARDAQVCEEDVIILSTLLKTDIRHR